jgi:hypothetical protein
MEININLSGLNAVAAWWGAIVATLTFAWTLYRWATSGPRVVVEIHADFLVTTPGFNKEALYTFVRVINRGESATTILGISTFYYTSLLHVLTRRPDSKAVIGNAGITQPVPCRLEPTGVWDSAILQDDKFEAMLRDGYVMVAVHHSASGKPVKRLMTNRNRPRIPTIVARAAERGWPSTRVEVEATLVEVAEVAARNAHAGGSEPQ